MSTLYREFILRGPSAWQALVAFIRTNAKASIDRERPLRVIVTEAEAKRRLEQNRYYWGVVITSIAEQAWVNGQRFSKDAWHEYFAREFGLCEDITLPSGEVVTRRRSTTEMTVSQFAEYTEKVHAYGAMELGVEFI